MPEEKKIRIALWRAAVENKVDVSQVFAIAMQESQLNPKARSPKDAVGVIQLMAPTARELGLVVNSKIDERYDFEKNIDAGVKYYAGLHRYSRLCNGDGRLACYNAGVGKVIKHKGIPNFKETKDYINKITKGAKNIKFRMMEIINNPIPLVPPEDAIRWIKKGHFKALTYCRVSSHFKWGEVFKGRTKEQVEKHFTLQKAINAANLAQKLEGFRSKAGGREITIISWFRDPVTNKAVGGVKGSQHLEANAVDYTVQSLSHKQVQKLAESDCEGGLGYGSTFTHYDNRGKKARWHY